MERWPGTLIEYLEQFLDNMMYYDIQRQAFEELPQHLYDELNDEASIGDRMPQLIARLKEKEQEENLFLAKWGNMHPQREGTHGELTTLMTQAGPLPDRKKASIEVTFGGWITQETLESTLKYDECEVELPAGTLRFPQYPAPCDYVRFVNDKGQEVIYYDQQEWVDHPTEVMGAIMAMILNGVDEDAPED